MITFMRMSLVGFEGLAFIITNGAKIKVKTVFALIHVTLIQFESAESTFYSTFTFIFLIKNFTCIDRIDDNIHLMFRLMASRAHIESQFFVKKAILTFIKIIQRLKEAQTEQWKQTPMIGFWKHPLHLLNKILDFVVGREAVS